MANNIKFGDVDLKIPNFEFKRFKWLIAVMITVIIIFASVYTIGANENGVVLRLGEYSHTTMPGLHFKIPFIDMVYPVKVDYQYKQEYGFRTLKAGVRTEYSKRNYSGESWMLTGDLNIAEVRWILQYKIKNAADYLFHVRDVQNTIRDISEATLRLLIGDRSFTEVLQTERVAIAEKSKVHMQMILDRYQTGISIKMVQLQSVLPPDPVADSFNEVIRAEQEEETLINEANQAFNKEIYRADGEAKQLINEAKGYAVERVNNANGDVALFEQVLAEYKKAPQITKDRYFIEAMNEVLSKTPNKVIVDHRLENFLPMLNLQNKEKK
ncbi:FtsH protease activity modulator HflK [Candidatus Pelagibacter communis]|uniref:FtsH protease activity modulator HflK n=2 Tax=Pelagibacter ubique TaxID=198252 RepID=UPI00094C6D83|nr:FtsH protease activity modulator HflK [Candidatus Pelagibacter ubique]